MIDGLSHAEHLVLLAAAYVVGVSSNVVASVLMRWLHRRFGRWWLEP